MLRHLRTINELMGAAGPKSEEVEVKEEPQVVGVIDVTELVSSPELGSQAV